jgi:DNA-binding transcriptional regulator YdaS (Cro superfamily)
MTNHEKILQMVIKKAGGITALSRALKITFQSIQMWKKIPAERVIAIEKVVNIPREKLRPDLYARRKLDQHISEKTHA